MDETTNDHFATVAVRTANSASQTYDHLGYATLLWLQIDNLTQRLALRPIDDQQQQQLTTTQREQQHLAAIDLPNPNATFRRMPGRCIAFHDSADDGHQTVLQFADDDALEATWDDIIMLQESSLELDENASPQQLPDTLPPPHPETLSQLESVLSSMASYDDGSAEARSALTRMLVAPASATGALDYVGALTQLFLQLEAREELSTGGDGGCHLAAADAAAAASATPSVETLSRIAVLLLSLSDDDVIHRLLDADAIPYLFGALERTAVAGFVETRHVNTSYRAYLAEESRFKQPIRIRDEQVHDLIRRNVCIGLLLDEVMPMSVGLPESPLVQKLEALQRENARLIVLRLAADAGFLNELLATLRATATCLAEEEAAAAAATGAPADWGVIAGGAAASSREQVEAAMRLAQRRGACAPALPAPELPIEQLWGLSGELFKLAEPLHPLERLRLYSPLGVAPAAGHYSASSSGLLECAAQLLARATDAPTRAVVRCLDVLLLLARHDPSVLRRAELEHGSRFGGGGAAAPLSALVARLVVEMDDEGPMRQGKELLAILLDPSTMEEAERDAFLSAAYARGGCMALILDDVIATPGGGGGHARTDAARVAVLLMLLAPAMCAHGFHGSRAALEPSLWARVAELAASPSTEVRGAAVRFARELLKSLPACANRVAGSPLLPNLVRHLAARISKPSSLTDSAALALLEDAVGSPALEPIRIALLEQGVKGELVRLAGAGVVSVRMLLTLDRAANPANPLSPDPPRRSPMGSPRLQLLTSHASVSELPRLSPPTPSRDPRVSRVLSPGHPATPPPPLDPTAVEVSSPSPARDVHAALIGPGSPPLSPPVSPKRSVAAAALSTKPASPAAALEPVDMSPAGGRVFDLAPVPPKRKPSGASSVRARKLVG